MMCDGCGLSLEGKTRREELIPRFGYIYCRLDSAREKEVSSGLESTPGYAGKSADEKETLVTYECGKAGLIKRLLRTYPKFDERDTWIAGTVKQEDIKTYIKVTLLNEGWYY